MDQDGADLNSHSIDNLLYEAIARGTVTPGRGGRKRGREREREGEGEGEGERERERERDREMQKSDENSGHLCTLG